MSLHYWVTDQVVCELIMDWLKRQALDPGFLRAPRPVSGWHAQLSFGCLLSLVFIRFNPEAFEVVHNSFRSGYASVFFWVVAILTEGRFIGRPHWSGTVGGFQWCVWGSHWFIVFFHWLDQVGDLYQMVLVWDLWWLGLVACPRQFDLDKFCGSRGGWACGSIGGPGQFVLILIGSARHLEDTKGGGGMLRRWWIVVDPHLGGLVAFSTFVCGSW